MPRLLAFVLFATLLLPTPALAQAIRVISGDHADFTRLVLSFDGAPDWRLARSPDGYILRLAGSQPRYDLSDIFRRITRDRLAAVWADPGDGSLRLRVACACHAIPFELRPGVLVVDIRDGPPPSASSFETSLAGDRLPPLEAVAPTRPRPRSGPEPIPFDWTAQQPRPVPLPLPMPLPLAGPTRSELREDLLRGFAQGAAEGLIDPVERLPDPATPMSDQRRPVTGPLRLGAPLETRSPLEPVQLTGPDGQTCPSDDRLDLAAWGGEGPAATQLSTTLAGLLGEFDRPQPDAVIKAVRLHLHHGFGAEARAFLQAFPIESPDAPLWASLGRLVDGMPDPQGPFRGLEGCDSAAALWALLADPALAPQRARAPAVLRAFSALPAPLRRHLGPPLAERFLAAGDSETAASLQGSFLRLPGPPDPRATIAEARITAALGATPQAGTLLAEAADDPGPAQPLALAALVDLHAADGRPLDSTVEESLAAYLPQYEGAPEEPTLRRAHLLSLALTGRFDAAFAALADTPEAAPDLWRLLAEGPDSAVLLHAIGADPQPVPDETRRLISSRLIDLGFAEAAQSWSPDAGPLPLAPPQADPLRDALRMRAWSSLPDTAPDPWRDVAASLAAEPAVAPPLARSRALTDTSAATRDQIRALLDSVPPP